MDVAFAQDFFEFGTQFLTTVFIDVEMLHRDAKYLVLELVDGESGIDEEHGVFLRVGMAGNHERGKGSLHGTDSGHAVSGVDIEVKEVLDETRGLFL